MKNLTSVVVPVFNEQEVIQTCLESLNNQSYKPVEIIVVDDGSTDRSLEVIKNSSQNVKLLHQKHLGPGSARNLGAGEAKGSIVVFVDSDMTFDKNFIKDLVAPILKGKEIGTFSKNEMVLNPDNIWSRCWNINRNLPYNRMIPNDYPIEAPVFRAILKKEFDKINGFDTNGQYTDDWSLSRKLGKKSALAKGAVYYHSNPSSLKEVFSQARWIGKNEFISGSIARKLKSIIFYNPLVSLIIGAGKSITRQNYFFIIFKFIYDFGIWVSVIKSFFGENKYK